MGDDTPIGAVKQSFIVQHYCHATTYGSEDLRSLDLSFQIHIRLSFYKIKSMYVGDWLMVGGSVAKSTRVILPIVG